MADRLMTVLYVVCIIFLLTACAKHNPLKPDNDPNAPLVLTEEKVLSGNGSDYTYRQSAKLNLPKDKEYLIAWRITTTDSLLPDGIVTDAEGWIFHYTTNADTSIPLSSPACQRTIWTSGLQQNWEFASANGKLKQIISKVEVKVIPSAGKMAEYCKTFPMDRIFGSKMIPPGFEQGGTTGMGIHVSLREIYGDIFVEGLYAHHFMYRINTVDLNQNILQSGQWYSTLECENIRELYINTQTTPSLVPNQPDEYTQLETYLVSRQGMEETTHHKIYFKAKGGFHAKTLVYPRHLYGMGQYHYIPYLDESVPSIPIEPQSSTHHSTNLFKDEDAYTAINSSDFKMYLAWGWHGQYGRPGVNSTTITDDPFDKVVNLCPDEETDVDYYSYITHFDLQMDGQPFPALAQFGNTQIVTHSDGTLWRRVKYSNLDCSRATLTELSNGLHTFRFSVVDGQSVYDPTPVELKVNLVPYVPVSQRNGILIIDDDISNASFCPEAKVDSVYQAITPTVYGPVVQFDRASSNYTDMKNRRISPTMLQNYKAVIYHCDYPTYTSNYSLDADGMYLYLMNGGKLVISGAANIAAMINALLMQSKYNEQYSLGFRNADDVSITTNNMLSQPYFVSANGASEAWPDIPLNISTSFVSLINSRHGLGPVTIFNNLEHVSRVYRYGCKIPGTDNYSPTQEQYSQYITKTVGIEYIYPGSGKVVVLGFPLSYMQQPNVNLALQKIIDNLLSSDM